MDRGEVPRPEDVGGDASRRQPPAESELTGVGQAQLQGRTVTPALPVQPPDCSTDLGRGPAIARRARSQSRTVTSMILPTKAPNVNRTRAEKVLAGLTPRHLADLRKSGLSDEQIARCGFYSLKVPASVQKALRWKRYDGDLGDCLCIPFRDAEGNP